MMLQRESVLLPGGQQVFLLLPKHTSNAIAAPYNCRTEHQYILSNGTGYAFLMDFFALGNSLQKNEIAYLPLPLNYASAFEEAYPAPYDHSTGIVIFNYTTTQIGAKDIVTSLNHHSTGIETVYRHTFSPSAIPELWRTKNRLTVKRRGQTLIISGNGDIFALLAASCEDLASYGDDVKNNDYPPHSHHDRIDNTAKSLGMILYYWHHEEKPSHDALQNLLT